MLSVSTDFKSAIKAPVKSVQGYLEAADGTLYEAGGDLASFTIQATGKLLNTSMKQIDITLNGEHSLDKVTAYYGVEINSAYEYETVGVFNILKTEYRKDTDTTKLTGYDNMVLFQKPYAAVSDFPTTLYAYTQALCAGVGVNLVNTSLHNGTLDIPEDYWILIPEATYRDVLRQICEVTVSNARINPAGNVELVPIENPSGETLTYDNLLGDYTIGDKWGGVNSVVLSRQPQNDDIYLQDEIDIRFPMNRNILDLEVFNVGYSS